MNGTFKMTREMAVREDKGIPISERVQSDEGPKVEIGSPSRDPVEKLLREVDKLIQEHAFAKAKLLLVKHMIKTEEGPELETIDQAFKTVELAEERFRNQESKAVSHERETLTDAKKLIEAEDFEEAIKKLEALKTDKVTASETRDLKNLVIEKLINRERNKAAKYFLLAKKASTPSKKEEFLLSSYKILKTLIEKYPSSKLINKLEDHLIKVRKELQKLGKNPG